MTEKVLQALKEKMVGTVEGISYENYPLSRKYMLEQFKAMDGLHGLHSYEVENGLEFGVQAKEENPEKKSGHPKGILYDDVFKAFGDPSCPKGKTQKLNPEGVYQFHRNLRGGYINELEAFVPEAIVRRLGIKHGDYLKADKAQTDYGRSQRYMYTLVEKGNEPEREERVQYNLCQMLQDESGEFYVDHSIESDESIVVNGEPCKITVCDREIKEFNLVVGDLVDVAFYTGSADKSKVIWKHESRTVNEQETAEVCMEQEEISGQLDGITVCFVGESLKKNLLEMEINEEGGTLLLTDGKKKEMQIRSHVKKSDVVVCLMSNAPPEAVSIAKTEAKLKGIPFIPVYSATPKNVIEMIVEHAMETLKAS